MAHTETLNQYLTPLSSAWATAVDKFWSLKVLPMASIELPRRPILAKAHSELKEGKMISDVVVDAYAKMMEHYWATPLNKAVFMDTLAFKVLKRDGSRDLRQLRFKGNEAIITHIMWPIHHPMGDESGHWSLVVCHTQDKAVRPFDSLLAYEADTLEACERIREYWVANMVSLEDASVWQQPYCCNRRESLRQAEASNDCGPMMLLAMRMIRGGLSFPRLDPNQNKREALMKALGLRMRQRMVAELVGDHLNPSNDLIPEWLKD